MPTRPQKPHFSENPRVRRLYADAQTHPDGFVGRVESSRPDTSSASTVGPRRLDPTYNNHTRRTTVKALVIQNGFGLENLALADHPDPTAGPGQVLVRVRAGSLNYRDLLLARGHYNPKLKMPRVLGSDATGEVAAVGSGVTKFKPGDRVIGCFMQQWESGPITEAVAKSTLGSDRDGVFSELAVFEERGVVPVPGDLSFEEAATLPCAAVTAWNALTGGGCGPGKTVLLQGTGGVSIFAMQLTKALGAKALITSGHDDKLARALSMGADAGTNYKTNPDWD